jgi:hypothetical protein
VTASVAAAADGDFVVVWTSATSSGGDTSTNSIQARRYASDGSALGTQFQVNTYTTSQQIEPAVSLASNEDFLVVWRSAGSLGSDTSLDSIQGQRYASNGSAQGGQFQVNSYTTDLQSVPSAASAAGGGFVVAWQSYGSYGTDTDAQSIQAQRYASDGSAQGAEFQVNTYTTYYQLRPTVTAASDGDFVVVWSSSGSFGTDAGNPYSIQGQRFASTGVPQGVQFQVNTYTTSNQDNSSVASSPAGDFVVVWQSLGSSGTDTSNNSIQSQRYHTPPAVPAMSSLARMALGGALLLFGIAYAFKRRS